MELKKGWKEEMIPEVIFKLLKSFPRSFISSNGEFIAHDKANEYFGLSNCKDEIEVKCKVLEWFSRGASKTEPFRDKRKNKEFNDFMLKGINTFLGTSFDTEEMRYIYQQLGNQVNRQLTLKFIESNYDLEILE